MDRIKVLVAEHEPELRADLCLGLRLAGYLVAEAPNGKRALDILRDELPDVIVLDLFIPAIGSVALLAELRTMHAPPGIRVIVLTENGALSLATDALSLGATDFLEKPIAANDVIAVVETGARRSLTGKPNYFSGGTEFGPSRRTKDAGSGTHPGIVPCESPGTTVALVILRNLCKT